jgi:hypothetical protein
VADALNAHIRAGVAQLILAFPCSDIETTEVAMAWFNDKVRPLLEPATTRPES